MRHRKQRFNLGSYRLLTAEMGGLYPCGVMEVLPGDQFKHSASVMVRLSPMAAPVMHAMTIRVHHFFVPHRLTWDPTGATKFEDFITGGPDGRDTSTVPALDTTGVSKDLLDYLGFPTEAGISVSALPLRAVNLVYNEWFRDQDLIGERDLEDTTIPLVAWEKDYLTTARPWAQKGEEVTLPLGTRANIVSEDYTSGSGAAGWSPVGGADPYVPEGEKGSRVWTDQGEGARGIWADLSEATAATINSLRRAAALQRFAEERARYGSRYAEYVRRSFGAFPLDARIQRPELLGMGTTQVSVSEILQTAPDATTSPGDNRFGVGDLYGHGIGLTRSNAYRRKFSEHGYVLSFLSVRPRAVYSNGIDRSFLRRDREDFFQPELAHIGQQQVLEREVYADPDNQANVFGWSDRYAEYRTTNNRVTGEFRNTLNYWHLARDFQEAPALNETFVSCDPSKRIFNVTDPATDALWVVASHRCQALRRIPKNAVGRLL